MNEVLVKQLINFGLTEKEAKIYLALLELEAATVFEIAKHSGINRSSAYVVLEALKKRGLAGYSDDKKTRKYIAASPDAILGAAKEAYRKQDEIKNDIESIIPELKALHKGTKHRPVVKIFEGTNGIREIYLEPFRSKSKIFRTFANPSQILKRVPDLMVEYAKGKNLGGMKMHAINPASKDMFEFYKRTPAPHRPEFTFIPEDKFKFSSDMAIYDNKVAIVSPKDNFGIVIESQEIADMLKNSFDLAFSEAKRLNKKIKQRLKKLT